MLNSQIFIQFLSTGNIHKLLIHNLEVIVSCSAEIIPNILCSYDLNKMSINLTF